MALTADHYLSQLQALLPRGLAWARQQTGVLPRLLLAWADELARVHRRCDELVQEADPRTTTELLQDWERVAGLPDPCVTISQTIEQRRAALVSKLAYAGGQSRAYFISLAETLGYPGATIDEFSITTCNDDCNDALYSIADLFTWRLNLPASTGGVFVMTCNSDCNSALQSWGNEALECRVNKFKPAHTSVLFAYI